MSSSQLRSDRGFTLIELMIVIAILAIIAAVSIPNLLSAKSATNETVAISTIKLLASVQVHCTQRNHIDIDVDGQGEFGFFRELTGTIPPRNQVGLRLVPPMLSPSFDDVQNGVISKSGYAIVLYLPDANAVGIEETPGNYASVDPDHAERHWCVYAWPMRYGVSGRRAFFMNEQGQIMSTDNQVQEYSGTGDVPPADSAFLAGGIAGAIDGELAVGLAGADGGIWKAVN